MFSWRRGRGFFRRIDDEEKKAPGRGGNLAASAVAERHSAAVTGNGATLYVAALGSDKVGIFSTAELEADTFVPSHGEPDSRERRRPYRPRPG